MANQTLQGFGFGLASFMCLSSLILTACGPTVESISELETLRVLSVRKTPGYGKPGQPMDFKMFWHDAKVEPDSADSIQIGWLGGCFNPPGDSLQGCLASYAQMSPEELQANLQIITVSDPEDGGDGSTTLAAEEFTVQIPSDIVSSHPPPSGGGTVPYGSGYVFFAVCRGTLSVNFTGSTIFPLVCTDSEGQNQLSQDFVAGYAGIFAYDDVTNGNPEFQSFSFNGSIVADACISDDCQNVPAAKANAPCSGEPTVSACTAEDRSTCPEIPFLALVPEDQVEVDEVLSGEVGSTVTEQMWLSFFADRGTVSPSVRLLNDSTDGYVTDSGGDYYAPAEPGEDYIWAVSHDNRGGQEWTRIRICVE